MFPEQRKPAFGNEKRLNRFLGLTELVFSALLTILHKQRSKPSAESVEARKVAVRRGEFGLRRFSSSFKSLKNSSRNKAIRPSISAWPWEHIPCRKSSQALFYSFPRARGCFQPVCLESSLGEVAKQPKRIKNQWEVKTTRANYTEIYHKIYMDQVP